MASQPIPPDISSQPSSTGVRRHHTISASSRTRVGTKDPISEEAVAAEVWNDDHDEVVDTDWVGPVGAVGEKTSSLHRQSSLPTRYHRAFQTQPSKAGNLTPKTMNSLTAIAGHEGDEEDDWEKGIQGYRNEDQDQVEVMDNTQAAAQSPLAYAAQVPSPPPAASGVRRHQSLTYGPAGGVRQIPSTGLKRSGTMQAQVKHVVAPQSPSPPDPDEEYVEEPNPYEDEAYIARSPQQYPASPIGRQSPWTSGSQGGGEWRNPNYNAGNMGMDDVQRALSALEIASNNNNNNQFYQQQQGGSNNNNAGYGSAHPPRFNPNQPGPNQARPANNNNNGSNDRKLHLVTDFDGRKTPLSQGAASASGYIQQRGQDRDDRAQTASGSSGWEQRERTLQGRSSNPNLSYGYQQQQQQQQKNIPNVPSIPQQYLQQQAPGQNPNSQAPRLGVTTSFGGPQNQPQNATDPGFVATPVDVPTLIATKGYNPANFDIRPPFARFFVIKSYTEDDVHKSLKYEIWSSTDPGNKRLDKAFKETSGRGPIYLFFSVNASGHFCGMAEMLTPVDYTRSSTVWASDKWKGVFKVRWIFVRDIPNVNLRHIKLNNTQERKPVTNSRDTQELLPDAGQEMLRIFHTHPARTSLLQDFGFYELQTMQKMQTGPSSPASSPTQSPPPPQMMAQANQLAQPNQFMPTMNMAYQMPQMAQMTPMMMQQMMQMNMNSMNMAGMSLNQFAGIPQTQAMHQSVMRHPSPGPQQQQQGGNGQQQGFGMPNY